MNIYSKIVALRNKPQEQSPFFAGKKAPAAALTGHTKLGFPEIAFFDGKKAPAAALTGHKKLKSDRIPGPRGPAGYQAPRGPAGYQDLGVLPVKIHVPAKHF